MNNHIQNKHPCTGLTPVQCDKVKEVGDMITEESVIKAPVNNG